MLKSPIEAAVAACLSLLLEVSGNPKAGNVDREHDFKDLRFEHFLASAAGAFPAFLEVAEKRRIGDGVLMAIKESMKWHKAENVHFGAFLLLVPLVASWDAGDMADIAERARERLKNTGYEDSLSVLNAFRLCNARVVEAEELNLRDEETEREIVQKGINLYDWMKMAPEENLIARELVGGYGISVEGAEFILNFEKTEKAVIELYYYLLSKYPDPLIIAKLGREYAEKITEWAKKAKTDDERRELDEKLLKDGANPGTIADLTASSIYLALAEGWRI
ncbi:MAG: triphosphoribosyl-dephospho-CoA synthase [Archaeoglobus sp.]|uniref:triphosphoribosyl-dephospho-CoA synthase n=1 Tax=Archaeoglobus sp. TaxID=1872626 RepID=UPI001D30E7C0|nr:triphosphoribosyl-dephospho-CoA synthase [Archaeoglobus sp.]MBO8180351.1 triphosphoribosyl-dephospho-CoA synthase [Archaeoglobus sp.]